MSEALTARRALVVGLGRSGLAAVRALVAADVDVVAIEADEDVARAADLPDGVELETGAAGDAQVDATVDLMVPSPGVPESAPLLQQALTRGVTVWSEPELGWRLAPRRVVGVTGTNGKTTVTELVTAMLRASGLAAAACGNIGAAFTEVATTAPDDTILVAELSSFQLRFCERLRPEVGVLVNLAPDHLDWHGDLAAYEAAKARLWAAQRPSDWAVGNRDDPRASDLVRDNAPGRIAWATVEGVPDAGVGVEGGHLVANLEGHGGRILALDELQVTAPHQISNTAVAAAAALAAGGSPEGVAAAARAFRPGRHRIEVVAVSDGITWIDDSKATNPHAAAAAL
ncbi:MAG: UDP-N-acetylmuramoyl-L-alanine--D-glutamate ligase, partial [Nitriliruptorales bacterium]